MTTTYRCTLTAGGFDDVDIPISSFQMRLRQSPLQCYLSVQIPAILDYATQIDDRKDGTVTVTQDVDGTETEVLTANINTVRHKLGGLNRSGEILAYKQITFPATGAHTLSDPTYRSYDGTTYRYRGQPDPAIKPEDDVTITGWETVTVNEISWNVSASLATMEFDGA